MWNIKKTNLKGGQMVKYTIDQNGKEITFDAFLKNLMEKPSFRKYYNSILSDCNFDAFFWENPPMTTESLQSVYEFVLIDSHYLARVNPDTRSFKRYFNTSEAVVDFPSLGADAWLIAPTPQSDLHHYTHIGNFVRKAPSAQIDTFWKRVGEIYSDRISHEKRWLSTSGLGVYWLHARVDSYPKYYQYGEYKMR